MSRPRLPVAIVGAGPTGITAAILLASYRIPTVVLDRWEEVYPQPRAVHLDDEVYRIVDRTGVSEAFARISRPARGLRLLDRRLAVLAELTRSGTTGVHGHPQANMFDQPVLEQILRDRVRELPLVDLRPGVQVTGLAPAPSWDGPVTVSCTDTATGHRHELGAAAVLGCDGANSIVRDAIGATMTDLGFEQRWLVVDVDTDADLDQWDGVHQVCDRHRAATYMRVGDRRYRWEFQLLDDEDAGSFRTLEDVLPLIRPWTGTTPATEMTVIRSTDYVFRAQVADRWRRGTVFLLGDAAHLTPPFIGQGMGAGLRDAHNLAWKLAAVLDGDLPSSVLDSYQDERKPHARTLIGTAKAMGVVMTGGGVAGEVLRRFALPRITRVPGLRSRVLDSESPRLRGSALLTRRRLPVRGPATLVGRQAPNAVLADGSRLDSTGTGQRLVTRTPPSPSQRAAVERVGGTVVRADDGTALADWLAGANAAAAVVRPDFTVSAAAHDLSTVIAALLPLVSQNAGPTSGRSTP